MANNRLYIIDTRTGEKFMLAKSMGGGWHNHQFRGYTIGSWRDRFLSYCARLVGATSFLYRLEMWLDDKDAAASWGNCMGDDNTELILVTENSGLL